MIDKNSTEEVRRAWQNFVGVEADGKFGSQTTAATKRFQIENNLRDDGKVGENTLAVAKQKGFVMPEISKTLDNVRIDVCLPESGNGFCGYNREDKGADQYGTARMIANLIALGERWARIVADYPLQIGDISRKGGGRFAPHASHNKGIDADLRPMRKDKKRLPVQWQHAEYDREVTHLFLRLVRSMYPSATVYFNDPKLIELGLCARAAGHDNHIHIRFN